MSEELPIPRQGDPSDGPTVIEWGADEPATGRRRLGWSLAGITRDPRLPVLLAGLGAVAGVASLLGEWLVMTLPNGGPAGSTSVDVPAGVSDTGGFGVGWLVGLLGLVCIVALALRGTPAVRPNARLVGFTLSGALLALLVAATATLDDAGQRNYFYGSEDNLRVEYGRGLVMAYVACVLFAAALRLAPNTPTRDDPPEAATGQGWRRRHLDPVEKDAPPAPADLTVTSAAPFARPEHPA
ncbi:hypothetical protein OOJ91_20865 [Micromonospora lupini]|uniref:hypothetical protein n=1 Tax=Micromonospora lupini TaxID=285679 RepID=UPI00225BFAB7|nr:hypothetical protein [Micromonospora lupini]MCX5068295.1 hypothetical protein [Micromonospora lupini]